LWIGGGTKNEKEEGEGRKKEGKKVVSFKEKKKSFTIGKSGGGWGTGPVNLKQVKEREGFFLEKERKRVTTRR